MAKRQRSELVAGLFALAALAAGVGVLVWLGATDVLHPGNGRAFFYLDQADGPVGLVNGSSVLRNDLVIGKIVDIRPAADGKRTLYVARIERSDADIRADGTAQVAAGMLGPLGLVVTSEGTGPAATEEKHAVLIGASGLDRAMNDLAAAAKNLRDVSDVVSQELRPGADGGVLGKIHGVLDDLKQTSQVAVAIATNIQRQTDGTEPASLLAKVQRSADDVNAVTAGLRRETDAGAEGSVAAKAHKTLDDINAMSADARPKLEKTMSSLANTSATMERYAKEDVAAILADLRKVDTELLSTVGELHGLTSKARDLVVLNSENVNEMLLNLKSMSASLSAAAKEIRRNPWRLLHKPTEKDVDTQNVYDAARAWAEGASQLDDALARLEALGEARPSGLTAQDPELKKIVDHLQASFEKFKVVEDALWKELSR